MTASRWAPVVTNGSVDLGAGTDTLDPGQIRQHADVWRISRRILGGSGNDNVTLASDLTETMQVDLGGGKNTLTLDDNANTGTVGNVGTLIGGTGGDAITLGTAANNASINLGGGGDTLTFSNFTNIATVANAETITGGSGNDTITLGSALSASMQVDLGAGANKLTLGNFGNTGSVSNVNTLIGGTGADAITLNTVASNASINLGGGATTR